MLLQHSEHKPSRKGKERDTSVLHRDPQPTDLDEKLTALRRRTAAQARPRERPEKAERDRMQPVSSAPIAPPTSSSHARTERSPKLPVQSAIPRTLPASPRRHASPHVIVSRPSRDADHEEFSRLKISSPSPRPSQSAPRAHASAKLFNPDTDPIPVRHTAEPEAMSDGTGSSYVNVPRTNGSAAVNHREERGSAARQLFDHRKDDPVRFSVMTRPPVSGSGRVAPTPKSSGDYLSASSTSSYAASISSSTFTLSSTTDGSSTSSALFDGRPNQQGDEASNNVFSLQLKRLYRTITNFEAKIKQTDSPDEAEDSITTRVILKGKEAETDDSEREKWNKQIQDHKQLAENIHNLLEISLAPSVPASLRIIPTKYNMIVRLWTYGFHKLLESLRKASFRSPLALEHLQEFIYYAYTFYTGLLEEPCLNPFKSGWLEALGDLARYRMAVAAMVNGGVGGQGGLTTKAVSEAAASAKKQSDTETGAGSQGSAKSISDFPAARIDDSPSPSIGLAAARLMDIEPEKERWRNVARSWYGAGLAEQPGNGKLHHHLGLLSREVESEELRSVYHFFKSVSTLHPFSMARESVQSIWSSPGPQAKRAGPDAKFSDLFVLLHGMLFTHIQMDDFQPTLARFIERLEIEGAEEREWIMMAVINLCAVLEHGRPNGVLRKIGCVGTRDATGPQAAAHLRVMAKKAAAGVPGSAALIAADDEHMDIDDEQRPDRSPTAGIAEARADDAPFEQPPAFKFALQITFSILSYVLRHPTRKASQYARSTLNPYLTIVLTFLSTVLKHKPTLDVLERSIPWNELAAFFATTPRKIMINQGLMNHPGRPNSQRNTERWVMLTSACAPPLPEDWCLRGMEWVGRKVYERGFWKGGEDRQAELEVLETVEGGELTDGTIEDDDGDDGPNKPSSSGSSDLVRRWVRIARCGVNLASTVEGFNWTDGTRDWKVEGKLSEKIISWKEEDRIEREEEEMRRMGKRWVDDPMDIDEADADDASEESGVDDVNDSDEIKELKARRRYLKSLLQLSQQSASPQQSRARTGRRGQSRALLNIVPGYTTLIVDTNILLSSLSMVTSLIESFKWTVIIPLPVIMELDGLSTNVTQLGKAADAAMQYISTHIRSHALSLKVQTSKGNYLTSLNVRTEEVDFDGSNMEKNMDDLILKSAIWQDDHWVDRSAMLKVSSSSPNVAANAVKVVLLSLDRNLRLKSRSRQLPAAGEKDLAALLASTTT